MKRILALSLSAALLLALLGGCAGGSDPDTTVIPSDPAGESATVPPTDTTQEPSLALPDEEPTEEVSEEPSAEPTQEPTAEPTQKPSAEPTQKPSQAPSAQPTVPPTSAPTATPEPTAPPIIIGPGGGTEEPTDKPSEDPNGFFEPTGPSASDINLANFYQTVLNGHEFPSMMELPVDFVANYYPGLLSIPVVQRLIVSPAMTGTAAAEIALVQVANSSDVNAVKSILQARIDAQAGGGAWYPDSVAGWQNNSRLVSKGNYVMLVVHEDCDAIVSEFNGLIK